MQQALTNIKRFSPLRLIALWTLLFVLGGVGNLMGQCTPTVTTIGTNVFKATFTSTTACNWTIPSNCTRIDIYCVGGGGAGGGAKATDGSGGGGGGGAASFLIGYTTFTAGSTTLTINVGAGGLGVSGSKGGDGGNSQVLNGAAVLCRAVGGIGGNGGAGAQNGGNGGAIANNIPVNTGFKGGKGANGTNPSNNVSGGGGGGASYSQVGSDGDVITGGAGGIGDFIAGCAGGNGISTSSGGGSNGYAAAAGANSFGGGGGGATVYSSGTRSGAAGANGGIVIIYTLADTRETFFTSGTWTVPACVTSIDVECWGGGGGGGFARSSFGAAGGGGGGGAYKKVTSVSVTPGSTISYTVGSGGAGGTTSGTAAVNGGNTTFNSTVPVVANGGEAGAGIASAGGGVGGNGGSGGTYNGGKGASGSGSNYGGGGGGSGGTAAGGNNSTSRIGAAFVAGGGNGGNGGQYAGSLGPGFPGLIPGGGGGGGCFYAIGSVGSGGKGGAGQITITYQCPPCSPPTSVILSASSTILCAGGSTSFSTSISGGSLNGGNWEYQFELTDGSILQAWSTLSTYSPTGIGASTYNVVVKVRSSACNTLSTTSNTVVVTVNSPPSATITPATSTSLCTSQTVVLNANTGAGLSYQWQLNGGNISGAINSSYTASSAGTYTVIVTSNSCPTTSTGTIVSVTAQPTTATVSSATLSVCGSLTSGSLGGNSPVTGTGTWSIVSGGTGNFSNSASGSSTFTANAYGTYVLRWTVSNAPCADASATVTVNFGRPVTWGNIQFPASGNINSCQNLDVYGKVYGLNVTEAAGANVIAELGWSTTNSNPNLWTNWTSTTFNIQSGNDDEYLGVLNGSTLGVGTFYYAFRYSTVGCTSYIYGGTGGVWNNNNGILNVSACINFGSFGSAVYMQTCSNNVNSNTFYRTEGDISPNNFNNNNFGSYFQNSGGLKLNGGEVKSWRNANANVCEPILYYSVYPTGVPSGVFSPITLPFYENCNGGAFPNGGPCTGNDQKWQRPGLAGVGSLANIDLTTLSPGTYQIEVYFDVPGNHTGTSGCPNTVFISNNGANYKASFTIVDQVAASNTGSYCVGQTIQLNSSSASSYSWSGPNSFSNSTQNPMIANATTAMSGIYTITSALANGCTQATTTAVVINTPTTPTFSPIASICSGSPIPALPTISNNGITGTWSPALNNTATTTYTFTPTAGQCAGSTSLTISIFANPSLIFLSPP